MWLRILIAFLLAIGVALMIVAALPSEKPPAEGILLHEADIVLQSSRSEQAPWFERVTGSPYSRMGLIELRDGVPWVIQVSDQVTRVPWPFWWPKGRDHKITILRAPGLTSEQAHKVVEVAESFIGRPDDPKFDDSDDRLYGAELIEKSFERGAGITLGHPERLAALRPDGDVITPASIASDTQLSVLWTSFPR